MTISAEDFTRLANNFYNQTNIGVDYQRIVVDSHLYHYVTENFKKNLPKYKVAFCWICLNEPYWQYAEKMINGAKQFFLPGHNVDYFLWSDMPANDISLKKMEGKNSYADGFNDAIEKLSFQKFGATIFPTDSQPWPTPTLMRFHLFLQQEEILKNYDYIFYCDVDMRFVNVVGDEILGPGLTAALHPGYAVKKQFWPPYEPNEKSASYIPRPGLVINDPEVKAGKRFMPMYFAGGLQGGRAEKFIQAMKAMRELVDKDMVNNYTPIWNDETAWNKYLEKTPKDLTVLTPSYIYPDSLIDQYYIPLWGCNYVPKLVTLTKPFTVSKEGGDMVRKLIQ